MKFYIEDETGSEQLTYMNPLYGFVEPEFVSVTEFESDYESELDFDPDSEWMGGD